MQDPKSGVNACEGCANDRDNWYWGGPHLRHMRKATVSFVDGHAITAKNYWYYSDTPWLYPDRGGLY